MSLKIFRKRNQKRRSCLILAALAGLSMASCKEKSTESVGDEISKINSQLEAKPQVKKVIPGMPVVKHEPQPESYNDGGQSYKAAENSKGAVTKIPMHGGSGSGHNHDHAKMMQMPKVVAKPGHKPVQCYGIAKAGRNACGSAHPDKNQRHGCAGLAKCDYDGYEWSMAPSKEDCLKEGGQFMPFKNSKMKCQKS